MPSGQFEKELDCAPLKRRLIKKTMNASVKIRKPGCLDVTWIFLSGNRIGRIHFSKPMSSIHKDENNQELSGSGSRPVPGLTNLPFDSLDLALPS